jgi:hypothetical protein
MPIATVLVPTHNHGRLLEYALRSALGQTVADLEIFIVGDGVDEATRVAVTHAAADPRVRFFDRPKGARHGEALRHEALQEARGEIVCYLSDDDLWLPEHVESLARALEDADFAHVLPAYITASQEIAVHAGHLAAPWIRAHMQSGFNFIPLSAAAHTLAFYRRLPRGWHPAPMDLPTDLHMWRQILAADGCRAVSTMRATLLNFPSPLRPGWSVEQREEELSSWSERLRSPTLEREISTAALDRAMRAYVEADEKAHAARAESESLRTALAVEQAALARADQLAAKNDAERAALEQRAAELTDAAGAAASDAAERRRLVEAMEGTLTWRLRNRLLEWRPLAALARRRSRAGSGS